MALERLDKYISSQTALSRSEARTAIRRGKITVNGVVVRNIDQKINTDLDSVELFGENVDYNKFLYIVMNKPQGVLSASRDAKQTTVLDILPENLRRRGLATVGRLDKDTTGLLLITDDGEFSHKLMSPKKQVYKVYEALLDGEVTDEIVNKFKEGVVLADGTKCLPADIERTGERLCQIRICEGKYHQVKRMLGTVGLGVVNLKRISIASLSLPEDLKEGQARLLTNQEKELVISGLK